MARPKFQGTINIDIRDSVPDWTPYEPPRAPEGAPHVLCIVLDDVGFSAMECYGGPIPMPNIDRIADNGLRYTQSHTTALCSPTRTRQAIARFVEDAHDARAPTSRRPKLRCREISGQHYDAISVTP